MKMISAEQVASALTWPTMIERLRRTFAEGVTSPKRHHHEMVRPDGEATMLIMPAWENHGYIGVKVINVFPQNTAHNLPAISGVYLLSEGKHGTPLACIDGNELTRRRTAAASALAAKMLARKDAKTLLLVGSGKVASMLLEAHSSIFDFDEVLVWGYNKDEAKQLIKRYENQCNIRLVDELEAASKQADIISCATFSSTALIKGEWLKPGTHLDLVGSFRSDMRESDGNAMARSSIFVDTYEGAKNEAGDIINAINENFISFSDIKADLFELTRGEKIGRANDAEITVFKSVGASLEDLAAAIEVWEQVSLKELD
ncbi:ornithine cyclodeaminase family protein [Marinomonas arenicola]|uniref:Ornithine cyclodeaminase family protein n=1 Tax=Marinomonas arenicola TaxID=569601 RepID=A0ABU9G886_9GAMM